jgi:hypothetical protein
VTDPTPRGFGRHFSKVGIVAVLVYAVFLFLYGQWKPGEVTVGTWLFSAYFAVYLSLADGKIKTGFVNVFLVTALLAAPFIEHMRDPLWVLLIFEALGLAWAVWSIRDFLRNRRAGRRTGAQKP